MKVMSTWSLKPGALQEAVRRFVVDQGAPAEGTTLLGRWHSVDMSHGYSLFETSDAATLYKGAAKWIDVLDIKNVLVIEDAQAGPVIASLVKK